MDAQNRSDPGSPDLLLIIPIAIIAGCAVNLMGGVFETLHWALTMPIHETGHAVVYWLTGKLAIPAPWMTVPIHQEFSIFSFLFFAALLYLLFRFGGRNNCQFFKYLAGLLAALLIIFSLFIPSRISEMLIIYSGLGGELYLSLLLIIIAAQDLLRVTTWSKNRLVLLGWGAFSFTGALISWIKISRGKKDLPIGALIDPDTWFGGESNGDLDRLMRDFGWTEQFITKTFLNTSLICLLILAGFYVLLFYRKISNNQTGPK